MADYEYLKQQAMQLEADLVVLKHHIEELEHGNPEPSRNDPMFLLSETDKSYIAGFIDGEGSFTVNRRLHRNVKPPYQSWVGYSAYVDIGNTDKDVIDWLHDVMGITSNVYSQKLGGNRRTIYRLRLSGKQSMVITKLILPYLHIKRAIAEKFLGFPMKHRKLDRDKAVALFEEVRTLNRNNGKGRSNIKYPGQYPVCVEIIDRPPQAGEEMTHSSGKSEGKSA